MIRRNIMIALGALVAGASALVYAERDTGPTRNISAKAAADVTITGAAPTASQAGNPKVLYDFDALPDPVKRMLRQIASAAESGDIEAMRPVFESNELKPMVTISFVDDPIAFWKKASADGKGGTCWRRCSTCYRPVMCASAKARTRSMSGPISPRPILRN